MLNQGKEIRHGANPILERRRTVLSLPLLVRLRGDLIAERDLRLELESDSLTIVLYCVVKAED